MTTINNSLCIHNHYYRLINIDNNVTDCSVFEYVYLRQMNIKQIQEFCQKHYKVKIPTDILCERFKLLENKGIVNAYELTKPLIIQYPVAKKVFKFFRRIFLIRKKNKKGETIGNRYPLTYFFYFVVLLIVAPFVPFL